MDIQLNPICKWLTANLMGDKLSLPASNHIEI